MLPDSLILFWNTNPTSKYNISLKGDLSEIYLADRQIQSSYTDLYIVLRMLLVV